MIFIGDVHYYFHDYKKICAACDQTLQLGDFGLGFAGYEDPEDLPDPQHHKFIRGNHDNPAVCRAHPNHLSDWGYDERMEMFWLAGGFSPNFLSLTSGLDWWEQEEVSYGELSREVIPSYLEAKPRIVVSHECPIETQFTMFPRTRHREIRNRTKQAMQSMWDAHKPEFWVFGHYHEHVQEEIGGTQFVCCGPLIPGRSAVRHLELSTFEIPGLSWT